MIRTVRAVVLSTTLLCGHAAWGQTQVQGSAGCAQVAQAAADGMAARIAADNQSIAAPQSVASLTCLDWFMNGVNLNVIDPAAFGSRLLSSTVTDTVMRACAAARASWNNAIGSVNCGLNLTGYNVGFGALGGLFCPRLSFGGGGPALGSATLMPGTQNAYFIRGDAPLPAGYTSSTPMGFLNVNTRAN